MDYNIEEFDKVNEECVDFLPITAGIERLLKDNLESPEVREEDYLRRIDDPPNIARPPVSEDLVTMLFSNDLPLVNETLAYLNDMLNDEIKDRTQEPKKSKKVRYFSLF